jgi:hypothetical protein
LRGAPDTLKSFSKFVRAALEREITQGFRGFHAVAARATTPSFCTAAPVTPDLSGKIVSKQAAASLSPWQKTKPESP